jgi:hypothetical protein
VSAACHTARDGIEMPLHRRGICIGHDQASTLAFCWADRTEQICALVALISGLARSGSPSRPLPDNAVLLPDPSLVLKPQFYRRVRWQMAYACRQRAREVFLNASTVSRS